MLVLFYGYLCETATAPNLSLILFTYLDLICQKKLLFMD
ncbi:hypothetical protein BPUTEOMOX_2712 [methanotrophic endosymbiont of Bathymodiolus puteoserpentis (Logatchev)]|nr:hypothetical protein BPUTEOMOX_2712 [methanotrophic endosymbiont of Bathymodiolus puteoserpentis (Logatchev)]